jgi:hypothetical protein
MTNGDSGGALATEILGTIAYEYKWPDFAPREIARPALLVAAGEQEDIRPFFA